MTVPPASLLDPDTARSSRAAAYAEQRREAAEGWGLSWYVPVQPSHPDRPGAAEPSDAGR